MGAFGGDRASAEGNQTAMKFSVGIERICVVMNVRIGEGVMPVIGIRERLVKRAARIELIEVVVGKTGVNWLRV